MSNKNDFKRHERSDRTKWVITGIVIVLILALLGGVIAAIVTETNPKDWFDTSDDNQVQPPSEVTDGNGQELVSGEVYAMPANMIFSTALADAETSSDGVIIEATLKPVTATAGSGVDWSVSFVDVEDDWVNGKNVTDYVTVTPISDGSTTATVKCLNDFGAQIKIECISRDYSDIKAECVVDFRKKIEDITYSFKYDGVIKEGISAGENNVYLVDYTGEDKQYTVECVPVYSDYTIDVDYTQSINGVYTSQFGYGQDIHLNTLALQAGLSGVVVENALSSQGVEYVGLIDTASRTGNFNALASMMTRADELYSSLTASDKEHSRIKNSYSAHQVLRTALSNGRVDTSKLDEANDILNSYTPPVTSGGFMGGVVINSEDELLQAALACNTAGVGIVEYTITFESAFASNSYSFSLGYTSSSITAVRDIILSDNSLIY